MEPEGSFSIHNSLPTVPILSQTNPVHASPIPLPEVPSQYPPIYAQVTITSLFSLLKNDSFWFFSSNMVANDSS